MADNDSSRPQHAEYMPCIDAPNGNLRIVWIDAAKNELVAQFSQILAHSFAEEALPEILSLSPSIHNFLPCQRLFELGSTRANFAIYAGVILGFNYCKCLSNEVLAEVMYSSGN